MRARNRSHAAAAPRAGAFAVRPVGDRACIIDLPDLDSVLALAAILRERRFPGVIDIVPAARTVLVRCADRASARRISAEVAGLPAGIAGFARTMLGETARVAVIDVVYDGPDLDVVGAHTGLGAAGVIAAHTGARWTAAFGGFAPGFLYLTGGDGALDAPRRDTPRERVEAGSVALAGGFSAVYPGASPGGWQVIGRTSARIWDAEREPAALLAPGDTVTFRAVREQIALPGVAVGAAARLAGEPPAGAGVVLTVLDPGLQTLVQDAGRPGHAAIGVSPSGAADRRALAAANLAVGNAAGAPALETLNAALSLRAEADAVIALAGTDAEAVIDDAHGERRPAPHDATAFDVHRGETLHVGPAARGLRGVLAVRGGIATPGALGSASRDILSGLGPAPLAAGDILARGAACAPEAADSAERSSEHGAPTARSGPARPPGDRAVLRFVPGPRDDWFDATAREALTAREWRLAPASNRVGLRFDGAPLVRSQSGELPSEGTVRGSIQVPPDGLPVLFLADHPVTGGYPVIGTVVDADTDVAAQLRPGARVRFLPVDADDGGLDQALAGGEDPGAAIPETVRVSLEVDGRRIAVAVPRALAAALDRLADAPGGDGPDVDAVRAALIAEILAAHGSR
ncbi:5-oxoprolinase/urea amidolyase family protein [Leucobacter chromiiresistens]|uniref:Sensor histidine kinase inhibitor, KipI family n=3 Tax=Leucobacter chromiiresistens TaxID=1079994 RepID=A0A1H1AGP1_9MICO|nr:5-oxoprolinase/urea amidolyase family protein [Leucobacter chromiiresistens]SDQ38711.1 sensor histidine kinase inhibitor, KipI family [Leucobacter chromiiresistens]